MVGKNDTWKYAHLDTTEATMTTADQTRVEAAAKAIYEDHNYLGRSHLGWTNASPSEREAHLATARAALLAANAASPASGGEWEHLERVIEARDRQLTDEIAVTRKFAADSDQLRRVIFDAIECLERGSSATPVAEILKSALAASPAPAVTEEWRTDIENAPKDGSDVLFPIEFVGRAYWCGDLKRWVLSRPLHMEFISHPTQFRTTPHQPAAMIRGDGT